MTEKTTDYGRLCVGEKEELFARAVALTAAQQARTASTVFTLALTGGLTPLEWYDWCVRTHALPPALLAAAHFTVSDERHVPLVSDESNFGHAARRLLDPLAVPSERRHPWPVRPSPLAAAEAYRRAWAALAGPGRAYDVCFLGLGDDAHTASIFPGSPLLSAAALSLPKGPNGAKEEALVEKDAAELFVALDTAKGPRLTITPAGLRACDLIIIKTHGEGKAPALKRIFSGPYDPLKAPAQILKTCADRVVWLVDKAAAKDI
ncbi:MAG TPA: 6-phosphogluconolactonase [Opitutaceae bacterium]|jgi:6-phosphogluconolactonase|nr:6-phosphogluconolactonase [Opitutaceae bacterium]